MRSVPAVVLRFSLGALVVPGTIWAAMLLWMRAVDDLPARVPTHWGGMEGDSFGAPQTVGGGVLGAGAVIGVLALAVSFVAWRAVGWSTGTRIATAAVSGLSVAVSLSVLPLLGALRGLTQAEAAAHSASAGIAILTVLIGTPLAAALIWVVLPRPGSARAADD